MASCTFAETISIFEVATVLKVRLPVQTGLSRLSIAEGNAPRKAASIKRLLTSNYGSRIWSVVVLWASTPILLRLLGTEAYGIVALYNVLYNAVTLMDLGLAAAANRELALLSVTGSPPEMRNLVRTFELMFAGLALTAGLGLWLGAPWLAYNWIHQSRISFDVLVSSLRYMSIAVLLQFMGTLHIGGLQGLRRHVLMNGLLVLAITLRQGGVIAIMQFLPPTPLLYFQWQSVVNALWLMAMSWSLWSSLPPADHPARFDGGLLKRVWRYAAGLTGISLSGLVLTQMDKFVLVKLLPLDAFAHYSVAGNLATGPAAASNPVNSAVFPQFVGLVGERREPQIIALYHKASQLVSVLVLPAVILFLFFAREVCQLWLGAEGLLVYEVADVLVAGAALMALTIIPHAIQLARGKTEISLLANVAALIIAVPALFILAARYGALGGAVVSVVLGFVSLTVQCYLMWTRLILPAKELRKWLFNDILLPLFASSLVIFVCRATAPPSEPRIITLAVLAGAWVTASIASALAAEHIRRSLIGMGQRVFRMTAQNKTSGARSASGQ